ncbi:DNA-directed RNA polymerase I subunit RPA12 [Pistacia vera]|uniref:DNA-directed RNA polymerase I subunit RPA12 n=1 Tax=Pistacia vera TaxID=55513 RepID=UPI001263DFB5|nr:DNA-directed RNA polymerase I subunit RPA12 [Pistacia vera]
MACSQRRDFMFCNFCGTMLSLEPKYATCPLCKFKRNAKEVADKEICYTVTAEDIRRELGISLFDKGDSGDNSVQWSKVKKTCEKCQNPEMHYSTRQTRSADEGQTTHYLCPRCGFQCQES